MASDVRSGQIPVASPVQGSQASNPIRLAAGGGKILPSGGKTPAAPADSSTGAAPGPQTLVDQLNKRLNDSGRPDQFRLDPASSGKLIQQVNPATGAVVGEFSVSEFPALARSIGTSGLLFDSLA